MYVKYSYTQEAFIYHIEWEFFKHLKKKIEQVETRVWSENETALYINMEKSNHVRSFRKPLCMCTCSRL